MTFIEMTPFLKGFYLTLNLWRDKRDDDWKMCNKTWMMCLVSQLENGSISGLEFDKQINSQDKRTCPIHVTASTCLGDDVRALFALFVPLNVPEVNLRSKEIVTVIYGFGYALGTGWGTTFTCGTILLFGTRPVFPLKVFSPLTGGTSLQTLWSPWRTKEIWVISLTPRCLCSLTIRLLKLACLRPLSFWTCWDNFC
jgi:hypothetical protein